MTNLVHSLESIIRESSQESLHVNAVGTVLAIAAGGFQTNLVSYLMHRDLFPALMKVSVFSLRQGPYSPSTVYSRRTSQLSPQNESLCGDWHSVQLQQI